MTEPLDDILRKTSIFRRLQPEDRQRLASVAALTHYDKGDLIFREGDEVTAFTTPPARSAVEALLGSIGQPRPLADVEVS